MMCSNKTLTQFTGHKNYAKIQIWKIRNASQLLVKNIGHWKSYPFQINGVHGFWELVFHPNGKKTDSYDYVSVTLQMKSENEIDESNKKKELIEGRAATFQRTRFWIDEEKEFTDRRNNLIDVCEISADDDVTFLYCRISIWDVYNRNIRCYGPDKMCPDMGNEIFVSKQGLLGRRDLLLPNDILKISCTLITVRKINVSLSSYQQLRESDNSEQMSLANDMNTSMDSVISPDVVLKVDEKEIPAHKKLLMSRSPVFASMFSHATLENETGIVRIVDVEFVVLRELVRYMYVDKCVIFNVDFALKLLEVADKYDIPSLRAHCAEYLNLRLSGVNVFDVLTIAEAHGETDLRMNCVEFICREPSSITNVPGWKSKWPSYPWLMSDIVEQLARKEMVDQRRMEDEMMAKRRLAVKAQKFVDDLNQQMEDTIFQLDNVQEVLRGMRLCDEKRELESVRKSERESKVFTFVILPIIFLLFLNLAIFFLYG